MEHFSPISASIGGALIGLSAALLWLGNGRIAGISGIFGQLLPPARTVVWRLVFLISLVGGAFLAAYLFPALGNTPQLAAPPAWFTGGAPIWIAASGFGICGLARVSVRSITATAIFFGVAMVVVMVTGIAR
jgi:hypothetical protein